MGARLARDLGLMFIVAGLVLGLSAIPAGAFTVVVLGSSTASGAGATPYTQAWAFRYQAWLAAQNPNNVLINRAIGGYTTYHVMPTGYVPPPNRPAPVPDRNITYAIAQHPDAIIINLPSNDAALNYTLDEQEQNWLAIAKAAADANIPLWVTTTQPRNIYPYMRDQMATLRDWIKETFGARSIDFWTGLAAPDGTILPQYNSGDGTHFNNDGHAILFQRVLDANLPAAVAARTGAFPNDPFGDVDGDGAVTSADVDLVRAYLSNPDSLTDAQKDRIRRYGDVSDTVTRSTVGNGVVDEQDVARLTLLAGGLTDAGTAGAVRPDYGDVDGDGKITIMDAVVVARARNNLVSDPALLARVNTKGLGDVSPTVPHVSVGDGTIDDRDVAEIAARATLDSNAPPYVDYWPLQTPIPDHPEVKADRYVMTDVALLSSSPFYQVTDAVAGVEERRGYTVTKVTGTDGSMIGVTKGLDGSLSALYLEYPYAFGGRTLEFQSPVKILDMGGVRNGTTWSGSVAATADGVEAAVRYSGAVVAQGNTYTPAAGSYPTGVPQSTWSKSVRVRLDMMVQPTGGAFAQAALFFDLEPFVGIVSRGLAKNLDATAPAPGLPYLKLDAATVRGITYSLSSP